METIPLTTALAIFQVLGLPGLVFVIWHYDNKKAEKERQLREKEMAERERAIQKILDAYRDDVRKITRFYEDNVQLVKGYERMCNDMTDTVRLNTSSYQMLADFLKNRVPCYQMVRPNK